MYNFVSSHETYKRMFDDTTKDDSYKSMQPCENVNYLDFDNGASFDYPCERVAMYLSSIKEKDGYSVNKSEGCKYLSYILYNELMSREKSKYDTLKFYEEFKNTYDELDICSGYIEIISGDIFENITKLCKMYSELSKFKSTHDIGVHERCQYVAQCVTSYNSYIRLCNNSIYRDLCNALEEFRQNYNEYMDSQTICESIPKHLPPAFGHNIIVISLIPIFTPLGSRIHHLLRRQKKILNNIEDISAELNHTSERNNKHSENMRYNIAYYSS
ncbi:PIR Superfamily Protein [Plasmodium ovale wallikeri]|uniref:PIR Superfamily Protein n=1 Tax=Plasmodium ovale wallikeri TaxID=864142 RepID=A0A1A9ANV6_PLAOA|nr:PIR Superfamily Protein [Plasmodium ovale wallikeri]